jgi:hypothetical protein
LTASTIALKAIRAGPTHLLLSIVAQAFCASTSRPTRFGVKANLGDGLIGQAAAVAG